ncbi:unnamed protein product [Dracunculus medinensis]|uniref:SCP domain-containing protein n=1 Tax=Dracunculus medinensis TaxID=318479 RepID=A0A0N4URB8_DRAME|nr:unnamed protein product [Dracunculus medinensis]
MGAIFVTAAVLYLVYMGTVMILISTEQRPLPVPNCNTRNEGARERGILFAQERKRQLSMNADISEDSLMEEWQYAAEVGCSQIFCRIADGDNKGMLVKLAACFYKLRSPLVGFAGEKSTISSTTTTAPTIFASTELTITPFALSFTECLDSVISTNTKDKIINRYNWFRKLIKYAISEAGGIISDQTDDFGFKWNCFLELSATQSARQCNFTHSKEPSPLGESRKILLRSDRQKIFWETRKLSPNESLVLEAVDSWWSSGSWSNHFSYFEHLSPHELSENYDFFTQLVNMETTYIGCGIGYCPAHHIGLNMHAIVCQYFPGIQRNSSKFIELWRVLRTYEEQILYDNDHSSGDMAANVEKCAQIDDNLFGLLGRETIVQPRNDLRG